MFALIVSALENKPALLTKLEVANKHCKQHMFDSLFSAVTDTCWWHDYNSWPFAFYFATQNSCLFHITQLKIDRSMNVLVSSNLIGAKSPTERRLAQQANRKEEISGSSGDKCWDQDLFVSNTGSVQFARNSSLLAYWSLPTHALGHAARNESQPFLCLFIYTLFFTGLISTFSSESSYL